MGSTDDEPASISSMKPRRCALHAWPRSGPEAGARGLAGSGAGSSRACLGSLVLLAVSVVLAGCGRSELEKELAARNESLNATIASLRKNLQEAKTRLTALEREVTEGQRRAEELAALGRRVAELEEARREARAEQERLTAELAREQAKAQQLRESLQAENADLEDRLTQRESEAAALRQNLQAQNAQLSERLARAQAGLAERDRLGAEKLELAERVQVAQRALAQAQAGHDQAQAALADELARATARHRQAAEETTRRIAALEIQREQGEIERMALERARGAAAEERDRARAELARRTATMATLEQRLAAAQAALAQAKEGHGQAQAALRDELAQATTRLQAAGETALRRLRALEGERDELAAQGAQLQRQLEQVRRERDEARARLAQAQGTTGNLEQRLTVTAEQLDAARARSLELTQRYERLLNERSELSEIGASQREILESTRRALEKAQSEVARLSNARGIYTVQEGDSLSTISAFFYRDGRLWRSIMAANSFLIGNDPDLIFPGMVLIIPN